MTPLYVHQLFALTPLSSRSMLFGTASPLHGANSFRHRTSSLLRPSSDVRLLSQSYVIICGQGIGQRPAVSMASSCLASGGPSDRICELPFKM
ncbi:hypothetical protein U9M48_028861 [Paspalum notatum var. saurae]|uniref:Uncharacterized protein n=1 Tax=Paspalum notatum var. saurae TaxID=547442 RepID=A0AAQ3TXN6_PASNO